MFYQGLPITTWALFAIAVSVLVVGVGGALLQARRPKAPLFALCCLVALFVVGVIVARMAATSVELRSWLEFALPEAVLYGFPSMLSLLALVALRRRRTWERAMWAVAWAVFGAAFASPVGFAAACALFGNCL